MAERMDALKKDVEQGQEDLKEAQHQMLHWANKIQDIGVESNQNRECWLDTLSQQLDLGANIRTNSCGMVSGQT